MAALLEDAQGDLLEVLLEHLRWPALVRFGIVLAVVGLVLFVARRVVDKADRQHLFASQLTMLALTLVGGAAVVLALPVQDSLIQSLLSLIGLVLSAVIALSATTFMGNALAGFMLKSLRNFKIGDFIRCGEHFGRVTEKGLVHTEIQTEDSDLTTLPNLYLVANPLTTVRASGTIVSATVSLGYDVPHGRVEEALLAAGEDAGLRDPFVQVTELGNFAVGYRLAGFSNDVKQLLSLRSRLRSAMLDALHAADIEIVSPTFMNQRQVPEAVIPAERTAGAAAAARRESPDREIFEKAEAAETLESLIQQREALVEEIEELGKLVKAEEDETARAKLMDRKAAKEQRRERFDEVIEAQERAKEND